MSYDVVSVTFDVTAQQDPKGRFSVPTPVCAALRLEGGDGVILTIGGSQAIETKLKSGLEIYGPELGDLVKPGERVRVTISPSNQHASR